MTAGSNQRREILVVACYGVDTEPHPSAPDRGLRILADLQEKRMRDYETMTSALLEALWEGKCPASPSMERRMDTVTEIVRKLGA
jgi:hypothetical protein